MNLIRKITKLWNPISYNEYFSKNSNLNVNDLNQNEYKTIKQKLIENLKILFNTEFSEELILKHMIKEINIFNNPFEKLIYNNNESYSSYMEKCLNYYFNHLSELKGKYFYFFNSYIRSKFNDKISDKQIIRYLNGDIKFNNIKTYYEELSDLQKNFDGNIFDYVIGYDSYNIPIFDEELIFESKTLINKQ